MKTFATSKTEMIKKYLDSLSKFGVKYESFEDSYIIHVRDDEKIFWLGVGYGEFLDNNS